MPSFLLSRSKKQLLVTRASLLGTSASLLVAKFTKFPEASFVALISGEPWFGALIGSLSVN